jgi:multidrug efflux system membrane fusion protein
MNDSVDRLAPADGRDILTMPRLRERSRVRIAGLLGVLLAMGLVAWWLTRSGTGGPPGGRFSQNGPMPVVAAVAKTGDMAITLTGLGTVTPLATVTVKSQISGRITQIAFKEGDTVKEGDFLLQIDPRPYQVALEQAEGALARDQALLANAKVDLARYQTLVAQDSIAEQQLATQRALVLQDEGTVKADQGQVDAARLNLVYCNITASIGGRLGLRQVDLGNYVTPGDASGIVVITQLQPITIVFTLPEDTIPDLTRQLRRGATLAVTAFDRSHTVKLATGTVLSIDNQVDTSTGTLRVKASFANGDETLFPNQFVNVDLLLDTRHDVTLVPQAAVQRGSPGTYLYVVDTAAGTVAVRPVTLGPGDATNVAIAKGLAVGETVVVDGADRLKEGAAVTLPAGNAAPGGAAPAQTPGRWRGHGNGPGDEPAGGQGQGQHRRQRPDGAPPSDGQAKPD